MAVTAQDVFARHFPGLTPDEVDAELSRVVPAAGATPISSPAARYLSEHGGEDAQVALKAYDEATVQHDRAVTEAYALEELLTSSLSIQEAATALAVDRSRISHRLKSQSLYAFTVQGRRFLPRWQFCEGPRGKVHDVIPGLAQIVPAIPRSIGPLALEAVMTEPVEDLGGRSPVESVRLLRPVEVVVDWLTALGHE